MIKNTTRSIGRVRISTSEVKRDIQRTIEKIKKMIKTTMTRSQRPQVVDLMQRSWRSMSIVCPGRSP